MSRYALPGGGHCYTGPTCRLHGQAIHHEATQEVGALKEELQEKIIKGKDPATDKETSSLVKKLARSIGNLETINQEQEALSPVVKPVDSPWGEGDDETNHYHKTWQGAVAHYRWRTKLRNALMEQHEVNTVTQEIATKHRLNPGDIHSVRFAEASNIAVAMNSNGEDIGQVGWGRPEDKLSLAVSGVSVENWERGAVVNVKDAQRNGEKAMEISRRIAADPDITLRSAIGELDSSRITATMAATEAVTKQTVDELKSYYPKAQRVSIGVKLSGSLVLSDVLDSDGERVRINTKDRERFNKWLAYKGTRLIERPEESSYVSPQSEVQVNLHYYRGV